MSTFKKEKINDEAALGFFKSLTEDVNVSAPVIEDAEETKRKSILNNVEDDKNPFANLFKEDKESKENKKPIVVAGEEQEEEEEEEEEEGAAVPKTTPGIFSEKVEDLNPIIYSLIDEGILQGYETEEGEDEYLIDTPEKLKQLIEDNKKQWEHEYLSSKLEEDMSLLPAEFKHVLDYVKAGGTDISSVMRSVLNIREFKDADISDETTSQELVKIYLERKGFGTAEEIRDQIDEWRDLDVLDKKAIQFKPKLEELENERIQNKIQEEKNLERQRVEIASKYYKGINDSLRGRELNGLRLTAKEAIDLENDLIKNDYISEINGRPLNLLAKKLEDITWSNPNYSLLAELTLHIKDPEGFKDKIRKEVEQELISSNESKLKITTRKLTSSANPGNRDIRPLVEKNRKKRGFLSK